jgi:hypothetical protein
MDTSTPIDRQLPVYDLERLWQDARDRRRKRTKCMSPGARRTPGAGGCRQAHAEDAALSLGRLHRPLDPLPADPAQACEERPLIRPGVEIGAVWAWIDPKSPTTPFRQV